MATTTSRANETRGSIDNNGTNAHAKFESMARRLYSTQSGNTRLDPTVVHLNEPVKQSAPKGDTSDPWRPGAAQSLPNGAVATKGAVPVKKGAFSAGDQGAKNAHTQPGTIKPVGSKTDMRKMGSVTTTKTLAALYPSSSRRA